MECTLALIFARNVLFAHLVHFERYWSSLDGVVLDMVSRWPLLLILKMMKRMESELSSFPFRFAVVVQFVSLLRLKDRRLNRCWGKLFPLLLPDTPLLDSSGSMLTYKYI